MYICAWHHTPPSYPMANGNRPWSRDELVSRYLNQFALSGNVWYHSVSNGIIYLHLVTLPNAAVGELRSSTYIRFVISPRYFGKRKFAGLNFRSWILVRKYFAAILAFPVSSTDGPGGLGFWPALNDLPSDRRVPPLARSLVRLEVCLFSIGRLDQYRWNPEYGECDSRICRL